MSRSQFKKFAKHLMSFQKSIPIIQQIQHVLQRYFLILPIIVNTIITISALQEMVVVVALVAVNDTTFISRIEDELHETFDFLFDIVLTLLSMYE